jgi:uncharacterized protein YyaL (SSP411 family)
MTLSLDNFHDRPALTHLKRLTTKDGLVQHADKEVPDPSFGYSIDDNARALIVCLWHYRQFQDPSVLQLAEIYFSYIERVEKEGGSFHNFLSFAETVLDSEGSEDSIGRAIWALGEVISCLPGSEMAEKATAMLNRTSIEKHIAHPHLRTKAYISLGLIAAGKDGEARRWMDKLAESYKLNAEPGWQWFEDGLFYANGILPYAIAKAAAASEDKGLKEIASQSFDWLDQVSREKDLPSPIGQNGWYKKGEEKALYDQQPLEAADMVLAASQLYIVTKQDRYLQVALEWMSWYYGHNSLGKPLINERTGGIYDALTPGGVNENQGAESIVTFLMAQLALTNLAAPNKKLP